MTITLPLIQSRRRVVGLCVHGSTELAANLFRITQTDEKIKKDRIQGQDAAPEPILWLAVK